MVTRFALALAVLAVAASATAAAERARCLSAGERHIAIASHQFVPLAKVMRRVKARHGGHILRVRLCKQGPRFLYVLTVLPRSGKVVQASVDAGSGADAGGS